MGGSARSLAPSVSELRLERTRHLGYKHSESLRDATPETFCLLLLHRRKRHLFFIKDPITYHECEDRTGEGLMERDQRRY
ncbi:Protein UL27 [Clarias magur]|uniref:Protein UL27 n=1 Tax=Clarias magur TaxID=1594786 RepID=A0A8J4U046_CLAMG|nr:Protein UL27 [Clarias magur]